MPSRPEMAGSPESSHMGTNTQLYDLDFYLWCLDTCATLGAREFEASISTI